MVIFPLFLSLLLALSAFLWFLIVLFWPRNRFEHLLRLFILGSATLAAFIEQFWAIPAYIFVIWVYLNAYAKVEHELLRKRLGRTVNEKSLRYHELLLVHRLVLALTFVFLGGLFLAIWDLHGLEDSRWAWWSLAFFAVFRRLAPLVDRVLRLHPAREIRWRRLWFFVAVVVLATCTLLLSERYAKNSFLQALAATVVFTTFLAALTYTAHPWLLEVTSTKLNRQGLADFCNWVFGVLKKIFGSASQS